MTYTGPIPVSTVVLEFVLESVALPGFKLGHTPCDHDVLCAVKVPASARTGIGALGGVFGAGLSRVRCP